MVQTFQKTLSANGIESRNRSVAARGQATAVANRGPDRQARLAHRSRTPMAHGEGAAERDLGHARPATSHRPGDAIPTRSFTGSKFIREANNSHLPRTALSLRPALIEPLLEPAGIVGEQAVDAQLRQVRRKALSPTAIDGIDHDRNTLIL